MTPGFTYRILIYTNDSPELWKTFQIIAGSPINIEVKDGVTYKWFVYSYNNNETLPVPTDTQNPTVEAPITKDLLFASGQLTIPPTPPGQNPIYPLDIVFNHKMAKISVKIDANILADYAIVNGLKVVFSDNDYIKNGVFNIKNNVMDSYNIVPVTEIINSAASNPTNTWNVTYYTADPESLASYSIKITDLPVTFTGVDPSIANVNLATFTSAITPIPNIEATFNFITPTAGQELIGTLNLSYTLSSRRILHVSNTTSFGYSFQKGPSWNMINALENFGNLPNSLVRMQPYATGQGVWIGGTASGDDGTNFLTALATTAQSNAIMARINSTDPNIRPDIVILAYDHWFMTSALQDALVSYINDGGVCIMMNEFTDINSPQSFLNKLFVLPANTITLEPLGPAGT